jgi:glucose-1-phosphate adenylyltransferase
MTQYKSHSLTQHIQRGWGYLRGELGEFVQLVPAQQKLGELWYRGTADCVYQNLDIIQAHDPELVLVLAGDHVYKMDYGPMIAFHAARAADVTLGMVQVPINQAHEFGIATLDADQRIVKFSEKPRNPEPMPGRNDVALASMGIYVFSVDYLHATLNRDALDAASAHDFGKNIIPAAIASGSRIFAYPFESVETEAQTYWRDVGTVDAFYTANMELIFVSPELNLYDSEWPIWTYQEQTPCAKFVLDEEGRRGVAINSMIAGGCIVSGAVIRESLLFFNVTVNERSEVFRSVVLPNARIGRSCRIHQAIVDEGCVIPDGMVIGEDSALDRQRFHVTEQGVVLVTQDMLKNCSAPTAGEIMGTSSLVHPHFDG